MTECTVFARSSLQKINNAITWKNAEKKRLDKKMPSKVTLFVCVSYVVGGYRQLLSSTFSFKKETFSSSFSLPTAFDPS